VRIAVTGSIATDQLMFYPGRFTDDFIADHFERVSVSFLVDRMEIRRGGVAANICYGMAALGLRPAIVGAVGADFADYRSWLDRHGVDTASVHVFDLFHTARFICTTDAAQNQIASFYPGAMTQARTIELAPVAERLGGLDWVIISPNDPEAMQRHTAECRNRGYRFVADPSQQVANMDGAELRELVTGAALLFCNAYEKALLERKTGWTDAEVLHRVGVRVTTLGAHGAVVECPEAPPVRVPAVPPHELVDPTGVGDAFRAGFLSGMCWGLGWERCAQLGSLLATYALETVGTQEYEVKPEHFIDRFAAAFGPAAAAEVAPRLGVTDPDSGGPAGGRQR